jgi:hypothetical protein
VRPQCAAANSASSSSFRLHALRRTRHRYVDVA